MQCNIGQMRVRLSQGFALLFMLLYKRARCPGPSRPTDCLVACLPRRSVRHVSPIRTALKPDRVVLHRDQPETDFATKKGIESYQENKKH